MSLGRQIMWPVDTLQVEDGPGCYPLVDYLLQSACCYFAKETQNFFD